MTARVGSRVGAEVAVMAGAACGLGARGEACAELLSVPAIGDWSQVKSSQGPLVAPRHCRLEVQLRKGVESKHLLVPSYPLMIGAVQEWCATTAFAGSGAEP